MGRIINGYLSKKNEYTAAVNKAKGEKFLEENLKNSSVSARSREKSFFTGKYLLIPMHEGESEKGKPPGWNLRGFFQIRPMMHFFYLQGFRLQNREEFAGG